MPLRALLVVDDEPRNVELIRLLVEEAELPIRVVAAGDADTVDARRWRRSRSRSSTTTPRSESW